MSNKLKGMIWLRGQVTLANKSILLQVFMPILLIFLYKFIFSLNVAGKEIGEDKLAIAYDLSAFLSSHVCWNTYHHHPS